jgi:hypothetical protein
MFYGFLINKNRKIPSLIYGRLYNSFNYHITAPTSQDLSEDNKYVLSGANGHTTGKVVNAKVDKTWYTSILLSGLPTNSSNMVKFATRY